MTLQYLLDTNVLSEPLRPKPDKNVLHHLQQHSNHICITSVVWHELLFGCYRLPPSARRSRIEQYLFHVVAATIPILGYDEEAASWHALERARLSNLGLTPSYADGQIAAVAETNDLVLVTANTADYVNFDGLTVEDWRR